MTSERLLNMSIKFYTSPKILYPENKFMATPLLDDRQLYRVTFQQQQQHQLPVITCTSVTASCCRLRFLIDSPMLTRSAWVCPAGRRVSRQVSGEYPPTATQIYCFRTGDFNAVREILPQPKNRRQNVS